MKIELPFEEALRAAMEIKPKQAKAQEAKNETSRRSVVRADCRRSERRSLRA